MDMREYLGFFLICHLIQGDYGSPLMVEQQGVYFAVRQEIFFRYREWIYRWISCTNYIQYSYLNFSSDYDLIRSSLARNIAAETN